MLIPWIMPVARHRDGAAAQAGGVCLNSGHHAIISDRACQCWS
jgi:hypothetical protein